MTVNNNHFSISIFEILFTDDPLNILDHFIIFGIGVEEFLEVHTTQRAFNEILILAVQAFVNALEVVLPDPIKDFLVLTFHLLFLRGIPAAALDGEEFLKDIGHLDLGSPTESLGIGQRDGVAVVDLGEQESIAGRFDQPADNAREAVQRQHGAPCLCRNR